MSSPRKAFAVNSGNRSCSFPAVSPMCLPGIDEYPASLGHTGALQAAPWAQCPLPVVCVHGSRFLPKCLPPTSSAQKGCLQSFSQSSRFPSVYAASSRQQPRQQFPECVRILQRNSRAWKVCVRGKARRIPKHVQPRDLPFHFSINKQIENYVST